VAYTHTHSHTVECTYFDCQSKALELLLVTFDRFALGINYQVFALNVNACEAFEVASNHHSPFRGESTQSIPSLSLSL